MGSDYLSHIILTKFFQLLVMDIHLRIILSHQSKNSYLSSLGRNLLSYDARVIAVRWEPQEEGVMSTMASFPSV